MRRMFDVGDSLRDAFTDARRRLHDAQAAVAAADSGSADAATGQVAQTGSPVGPFVRKVRHDAWVVAMKKALR
jgi:hypothetical protein